MKIELLEKFSTCSCEHPEQEWCYMNYSKGCRYFIRNTDSEKSMLDELEEYKDKLTENDYNKIKDIINGN